MRERPNPLDHQTEPEPAANTRPGTRIRDQSLRDRLQSAGGRLTSRLGEMYNVLNDSAPTTSPTVSERGSANRDNLGRDAVRRPIRPSELIDNDMSTSAVFLVVTLLLIVVGATLFFALSSTFPTFAGP